MSNPILFFIFILVIDLVLKSLKNKKVMEQNRGQREEVQHNRPDLNKEIPIPKSEPIRDIMSTLREEVEKERRKELERRQVKIEPIQVEQNQEVESIRKASAMAQKTFEDEEYWNNKRKITENEKLSKKIELEKNNKTINMREDIIKGIIFSEILSEPKSIKNQKRSM